VSDCGLCPDQYGKRTELVGGAGIEHDGWLTGVLRGYEVPGWLALLPGRHIGASDEFTDTEAAELGVQLREISAALRQAAQAERIYSVSFGERLPHWHLLVMAVPASVPQRLRGPAILPGRRELIDEPRARSIAAGVAQLR
jgi:hypothetical protein